MTNMDQAEGKMTQLKGKIKETWGKLTDNDIMLYKGQHEQFLGKLKEHYGLAKEEAEKKLKSLEEAIGMSGNSADMASSNSKAPMPMGVTKSASPTTPTTAKTDGAMPGVAK